MILPMPMRRAPGLAFSIAAAMSALATGTGLVMVGMAWAVPHVDVQALHQGARLYAAECASCHGLQPESAAVRMQAGAQLPPPAPPLGATGHAWRHSDAELTAIVGHGVSSAASPNGAPSMPGFAGRLGPGEISAVLAFVKNRWPANIRAYQATLNPSGGQDLAAALSDPAWVFPGQCLSPQVSADSL